MNMQEIQAIAKQLQQERAQAYREGAQAACSWLEEVYGEGIRETDAWATYMDDEEEEK
jgi:hypothetical protein